MLEARPRPGGPVLTVREAFTDGLYCDAGGFRFRDDHDLVIRYARLFNLPFDPFYPSEGDMVSYIGGSWKRRKRGERIDRTRFPRELTRLEQWIFAQERDTQMYKIRGGADLLPRAFAVRLQERISYGTQVVRIEQDSQAVKVVFFQAGLPKSATADRLICAIPFSVLRDLEIFPPFVPQKRSVITELTYASASLVFLQVRNRFWVEQGLSGFTVTDNTGEIWNATFDRPGPRGILLSYTRGALARQICAMAEDERIRYTLEQLEQVYPGIRASFESGESLCWEQSEWARGAQSQTSEMRSEERRVGKECRL